MKNKVSERLKLKYVDSCKSQYKEFLQALEVNPTINMSGLYESEIENGLFIEAEVIISMLLVEFIIIWIFGIRKKY